MIQGSSRSGDPQAATRPTNTEKTRKGPLQEIPQLAVPELDRPERAGIPTQKKKKKSRIMPGLKQEHRE